MSCLLVFIYCSSLRLVCLAICLGGVVLCYHQGLFLSGFDKTGRWFSEGFFSSVVNRSHTLTLSTGCYGLVLAVQREELQLMGE
jgi:hypothetical protein